VLYPDESPGDYEYVIEVNPWRFYNLTGHTRRFDDAIRRAESIFSEDWFSSTGLRLWMAGGGIGIRSGCVRSVSADVYVQGRNEWLGQVWTLAAEGRGAQPLLVGTSSLKMGYRPGDVIKTWVTPDASQTQAQAARNLNRACFTSFAGCNGFCELTPGATRYLMQHPEAATNIAPPECP
jgi:hypothetical protein